jgi:hypothetical protein
MTPYYHRIGKRIKSFYFSKLLSLAFRIDAI